MKFNVNRVGNLKKIAVLTALTVATFGWIEKVTAEQLTINSSEVALEVEEIETPKDWSNVELIRTFTGHTTAVDSLIFTLDSKMLISGGGYNDPLMRFWWVETGREIEKLRAQRTAVTVMAISPNGETLVSSGNDAGINLWDWKKKKYTATFLDHSSNVMSLAITPDSEILISAGLDGIRLWDLNPQRPLYTLVGFGNPTYALAIHPNGYILASGNNRGKIQFWNLRTGRLRDEFIAHNSEISGLAFAPDGKTLITSSYDRTIKVWDLSTGRLRYTLIGHTARIRAIAMNPDGKTLASCSNDGVRLWDVNSGKLLTHLADHGDWVQSLAFSPDGRFLASGGFDFRIKLWQSVSPK